VAWPANSQSELEIIMEIEENGAWQGSLLQSGNLIDEEHSFS